METWRKTIGAGREPNVGLPARHGVLAAVCAALFALRAAARDGEIALNAGKSPAREDAVFLLKLDADVPALQERGRTFGMIESRPVPWRDCETQLKKRNSRLTQLCRSTFKASPASVTGLCRRSLAWSRTVSAQTS